MIKQPRIPWLAPLFSRNPAAIKALGRRTISRIFLYVMLAGLSFVFLFPILYMMVTSFMPLSDILNVTVRWIPTSLTLENYGYALKFLGYDRYIWNSLMVVILSTVGHIASCALIAYGFARYKFPGSKLLFVLVLLTIIVPVQVLLVPTYLQYSNFGWIGTYFPIILPTYLGFGLRGGLYIFIFRQFFLDMSKELEEAARIDGCGSFKIFYRIMMPLARPAIVVSTLLSVVWHWNDYLEPSLYLTRVNNWMLTQHLPRLYTFLSDDTVRTGEELFYTEGTVMAGTLAALLPVIIVYLFLQKGFVEGIEKTGIKE